jgi:uncharacterized protein DUF1801
VAEAKTKPTGESVTAFLDRVTEGERRKDCAALVRIMKQATGAPPKMWGAGIVGFGSYTLTYASGRTGDWPVIAFAPRKQELTLYLSPGSAGFTAQLKQLGKHKLSGSCLHIKRLSDVDAKVLAKLLGESVKTKKAQA